MAGQIHNPLEQFTLKTIIPINVMGYDLSFTNASFVMVVCLGLLLLFLGLSTRKISLVPGRLQAFAEILYQFIVETVQSSAGEQAKKYVPFVFTLFMFILVCNLLGLVPYSFTVTSHIAVTFAMALVVFLGVTIIGFARHGLHFFSLFMPEGVPLWLAPLVIPIEVFAYLIRPVSLSVRLAANMTAGHVAMKVIAGFVLIFPAISLVPFALVTVLVGFEIFVAILQAYIFAILSCVYLNDAINLH